MNTKKRSTQYPITASACRFAQRSKGMSGRALAQELGIHHKNWQRYLAGHRRPPAEVKSKLADLLGVESFTRLIQLAYRHPFNP